LSGLWNRTLRLPMLATHSAPREAPAAGNYLK
jgi:hypothetical protein